MLPKDSLKSIERLMRQGKIEEATQLAVRFDDIDHKLALGVLQRSLGNYSEALRIFESICAEFPYHSLASTYAGMMNLMLGNWKTGWNQYQSRWNAPGWEVMRYPRNHLWNGQIKKDLQLLIWFEQGYGDTIQFSRYVQWIVDIGIQPILHIPDILITLFKSSFPNLKFLQESQTISADAHIPMLDIPIHIPDFKPELFNLPYIKLHSQRTDFELPEREMNRVGLVWRGRSSHPDDWNRSIPESELKTLLEIQDIKWVLIQQEEPLSHPFSSFDRTFCKNFYETAKVIDSLDLVISVDTAVAHLAGAMGKRIWLLLPSVADWRWGIGGNDSAWYPTMRLFRKEHQENWNALLSRVSNELRHYINQMCNSNPPTG